MQHYFSGAMEKAAAVMLKTKDLRGCNATKLELCCQF